MFDENKNCFMEPQQPSEKEIEEHCLAQLEDSLANFSESVNILTGSIMTIQSLNDTAKKSSSAHRVINEEVDQLLIKALLEAKQEDHHLTVPNRQ